MTKTKKEYFAELRTYVSDNTELLAFINHEVELLTKKNSAPKKPTQRQIENEHLKDVILAMVEKPMTITDMLTAFKEANPTVSMSPQRLTAVATQLVEDNSLVRTVVKRKAYFSKA